MTKNQHKCTTCRQGTQRLAAIDYSVELEHDGRSYPVSVKDLDVFTCDKCGARLLPDASQERLENELRRAAGLLMPREIARKREALGLTQKDFAALLRVAPATVSRWETGGQIQQRVMDVFMRAFFEVPELRCHLGVSRSGLVEAPPEGVPSKTDYAAQSADPA